MLASASLSYTSVDPIITGSVNNLFNTASFTGPNRVAKTDRVRPAVDVLLNRNRFECGHKTVMRFARRPGPY